MVNLASLSTVMGSDSPAGSGCHTALQLPGHHSLRLLMGCLFVCETQTLARWPKGTSVEGAEGAAVEQQGLKRRAKLKMYSVSLLRG